MRHNAALYFPYDGVKPRRGPTPRYGQKLNYKSLPAQHLSYTQQVADYRIDTYQMALYHKDYPDLLKPYRAYDPDFSVRDLKAQFRARRYLSETIKMLLETPEPDLISRIWQRLALFSGIRTRHIDDFAA